MQKAGLPVNPNDGAARPLNSRFLVLAGLVIGLVLLGLLTFNGGLIVLSLPLVVYLGATLLHRPPVLDVGAVRDMGTGLTRQFEPVTVRLTVTNYGNALDEVLIEDYMPGGLQLIEGKTSLLTSLPKGAQAVLEYTVKGGRGSYTFGDVMVSATEHLGVMRRRTSLNTRYKLIYLPDLTPLRRVAIRPQRTHGHFGPIPSRKSGSGVDFIGLREYQMGDPRRWINWRASARYEHQLHVNQFELERIADVGIILDARRQSNIELEGGPSLFEYSVQAAGSLSQALLDEGNRVGLLVYGFGMERVFPGYGKVQQERIVYALGQARTGHNFALESLGYLPTRFFPTGSQIIMISPLLESDVPAFTQLRACGYEVMLVSPDPVSFEGRLLGLQDDLSSQIARSERALLLRKIQRLGIRILDWDVERPFEPMVRASFSRVAPGVRLRGVMR